MNRAAVAKGSAIAVLALLILGGAIGLYYYTSTSSSSTTTTTTASSSASSSTSQSGTNSSTSAPVGPASGTCVTNAQGQCTQPQGAWADYLGYIPAGYVLAPRYLNSYTYPCPSGMNAAQCTQFQASCGNGVCDPNESCATCPIDCGVPGELTCDPYTGRAGAPISVCQVAGRG